MNRMLLMNSIMFNEKLFDILGIGFMFYKLSQMKQFKEVSTTYLNTALHYVNIAKELANRDHNYPNKSVGFLSGDAGVYALSTAILTKMNQRADAKFELDNFCKGFDICCKESFYKHGSDELFVGRAGYLCAALWLNRNIYPDLLPLDKINKVCQKIYDSGKKYAKKNNSPLPLMYVYHRVEYLGAAHGLVGILHVLLMSPWFDGAKKSGTENIYPNCDPAVLADIRICLDTIMGFQDIKGNFPLGLGRFFDDHDKVQWCHGAPGMALLFMKAYNLFQDIRYLESAKASAKLIWQEGLLTKGPGLCHGIAGNGYIFLLLYRITEQEQYLYYATRFFNFLTTSKFLNSGRIPDRPYSLFEGIAGTVCFVADLLDPLQSEFPFFPV